MRIIIPYPYNGKSYAIQVDRLPQKTSARPLLNGIPVNRATYSCSHEDAFTIFGGDATEHLVNTAKDVIGIVDALA